jgi:hypothetical protein
VAADVILHNARIATNRAPSFAEAVVIEGGSDEMLRQRGPATLIPTSAPNGIRPAIGPSTIFVDAQWRSETGVTSLRHPGPSFRGSPVLCFRRPSMTQGCRLESKLPNSSCRN